jgi:4-hydroxythreonine-4-phosphate dehydrogenase
MYHDPGLPVFKLVAGGDGVNTTLGLPFVRVSPDHGTAFDIAGRDLADPASMASALGCAARLLNLPGGVSRREHP